MRYVAGMQGSHPRSRHQNQGQIMQTIHFHIRTHNVKPHLDQDGALHVCVSERTVWLRVWRELRDSATVRRQALDART